MECHHLSFTAVSVSVHSSFHLRYTFFTPCFMFWMFSVHYSSDYSHHHPYCAIAWVIGVTTTIKKRTTCSLKTCLFVFFLMSRCRFLSSRSRLNQGLQTFFLFLFFVRKCLKNDSGINATQLMCSFVDQYKQYRITGYFHKVQLLISIKIYFHVMLINTTGNWN